MGLFDDLLADGDGKTNATPAVATTFGYKDPEDNGVGAWGDVTNRPDVHGVSLPIPVLKQQFGDENKAHGQLVKVTNPDTGQSVVAPIIDKGPADWVVARQGNTIDLTHATNKAIGGNGKTPVTYEFVNQPQSKGGMFDDLLAENQEASKQDQEPTQAGMFDDLLGQENQSQSQAGGVSFAPGSYNLPPMGGNALSFGSVIPSISKLPSQQQNPQNQTQSQNYNPIENALRNFASTAATSTLNSIGGAVRYFGGAQQKDLKMAQDELAQANSSGASQDQIDEIQGRIDKFKQEIPQVQDAAKSLSDLSSQYPIAYGVNPQDRSISAQIGRGLGSATSMIPTMATGPAGMALGALQGASQAYEDTYQNAKQTLQSQGMTDESAINEQAQRQASEAAVKTAPALAAYLVGGKLASAGVSKLLSTQTPLIQGIAGTIAGSVANTAAGSTIRKIMGESAMPTPESLTQDIAFGLFHGIGTGVEAQEKLRQEQEIKAKQDAAVGGPAPSVAPSANPIVNEREAKINAMANEQAPIPEAPKPMETAPVAPEKPETPADVKMTELLLEQLLHDEGSPEHTAIQQQIDQLKADKAPAPAEVTIKEQPAEAPAEAQPTTPDAVQEPSAREVGVRNAPAVGEGVGAENKPEVPAKEGQATKEEVTTPTIETNGEGNLFKEKDLPFNLAGEELPPEPEKKTTGTEEEQQLPMGEQKPPNPYRELLHRFYHEIRTHGDFANAVQDLAKKEKNKHLQAAADKFLEEMQVGEEPNVEALLSSIEIEANDHDNPPEPTPKTNRITREIQGGYLGIDPVMAYLQENPIMSKSEYLRRVKKGEIKSGGGAYDDAPTINKGHSTQIYSTKGEPIDNAVQALVDQGLMPEGSTAADLWNRIEQSSKAAERRQAEEKAREDFEKKVIKKSQETEKLRNDNPELFEQQRNQELKDWFDSRRGRESGFTEFPRIIYDGIVEVASSLKKAGKSFADWSKDMVGKFGEGVRNYLRQIYNAISTGGGRFTERGAERGAIDIGGDERFKPKEPTEQEAFAKKAADAFLKGRGTPITEEEMASVLARKFPGITSREASDLYATATGKPKPPTPYAGVASQPSGETISIRSDDQKDHIKRGILTSVVPAGEGTSRSEILEQGNTNLKNGANPFDALEKAKKGDFDALTTAKAYSQALAKKVSDALKKFGPNSPEYKELAKQYQDYYEGIREAGTVASDILRTFQGQTDLSDAADIARQYTQITGDEPSLSKHEQIRKVADEVKTSIEQSDKAIEDHKSTMDEGLADVEVQTPTSVEEGRQQIADLSDAQGKKAKDEIDRLNNELEQTKKDLEEVRQAKATGQDAESLKSYYEAKLKDLQGQLDKTPKYGKQVFEQARKIVDKLEKRAEEADKRLKKKLAQLGAFPDVTIVKDVAEIMAAHIARSGLEFAESSALVLEKYGPKIRPFLKDAWAMADKIAKGEGVDKTTSKKARQAKEKPVSKMTPAEKAADNIRKRIAQAEKKINDLNSGKITTPKDVEKVTNDEIKRLEAEYNQKKTELADARLKAKQRELFEKGKVGEDLNPQQVKTLWESAKRFYLDKGESDYDKMINDLANDFGITTEQVREAFSSPKGAKKTSDQLYLKQRNRQLALNKANRWLENQKANFIGKVFGAAAERTFKLAIFGHGTAFIGTHAPTTIYTHPKAAFRAWLKGLSYTFRGKDGRIKNAIDNKDLIYRPNWVTAKRAGLENDPFQNEHEGPSKATSDSILGRSLDALTGGRGFDALYHLRQDMFDQAWDKLSITQKTPEMAKIIADSINNSTGFTKGGKNTAGILQSPITKVLFFAPKLIASRFNWLIGDPARMIGTFGKMANPFAKVTPEERMSAFSEAKNKLAFLGTLAGTLLANQALLSVTGSNQSINFTDPKKNDWLAYKGFGYNFTTVGAMTRIARLLSQEYNAVFGDLTRIQKARGGREAAMKDALYTYFRSGFSPIVRDIVVGATGKDYIGNVVPWSSEQPDRGRRRLTWGEIVQEQFAPIPISEAATQKEIGPAIAKAGTAAFLGARLETPADIEEYQKSLQSKPRGSFGGSSPRSKNPFGGF